MTARGSRSDHIRSLKSRRRNRLEARRRAMRNLQMESLEDRRLLATGPQLIAIQPNGDELLFDGDVRDSAPTKLTFRFDENTVLDPDTIADGIQLIRGNQTGIGGGDDIVIEPGFID